MHRGDKYDYKCDIWSCGVLAYQLLSNELPFGDTEKGATEEEICENVNKCEVDFSSKWFQDVSQDGKSFIKYLLQPNERKRPTAEKALAHKWLSVSVADPKDNPNLRLDQSPVAMEALSNFRKYVVIAVWSVPSFARSDFFTDTNANFNI